MKIPRVSWHKVDSLGIFGPTPSYLSKLNGLDLCSFYLGKTTKKDQGNLVWQMPRNGIGDGKMLICPKYELNGMMMIIIGPRSGHWTLDTWRAALGE